MEHHVEDLKGNEDWKLPLHIIHEYKKKQARYCVCVPVINEGERIREQLKRTKPFADMVDIILLDGGSTDGSMDEVFLKENLAE